jgi:hypothetical protein
MKEQIHEKDNDGIVDELDRFGWNLRLGRVGSRGFGGSLAEVGGRSPLDYGDP